MFKKLLVLPKDKGTIKQKSGVTYWYKCDRIECEEDYVGVSSKVFGEIFKENLKVPSTIYEHQNTISHVTSVENFQDYRKEGAKHGWSHQRNNFNKSQQPHT